MNNLFIIPQRNLIPFKWDQVYFIDKSSCDNWAFAWNGRKIKTFPFGAILNLSDDYEVEMYTGTILSLYAEVPESKKKIWWASTNTPLQQEKVDRQKESYDKKQKAIKDFIWNMLHKQLNDYWEKLIAWR
jgi:hypothetical protein